MTWPEHKPPSGTPAGGPGQGPPSGIPARNRGTRPPFTRGDLTPATHGARSPRVYGALAEQLAAGLTEDRPDLAAYPESVAGWATAEAQAALMRRHLAERGTFDDDGEPRASLLSWLRTFERLAAQHRATLGLDPRSEAALARERAETAHLAVDIEAIVRRGQDAIAAREAAGLPAPPDLAGEVLSEQRAAHAAERAEAAAAWNGASS